MPASARSQCIQRCNTIYNTLIINRLQRPYISQIASTNITAEERHKIELHEISEPDNIDDA